MIQYIGDLNIAALILLGVCLAYLTSWVCDVMDGLIKEDELLIPYIIRFYFGKKTAQRTPWWGMMFFSVIMTLLFYRLSENTLATFVFAIICVPASILDLRHHIIPEELTWSLLFAGVFLSPWYINVESSMIGAATACAIVWFALAFVGFRTGLDTRSGGDVAAASAAGAWVGFENISGYLLSVSTIFIIACIFARRKKVYWLPMGPALFISIPLAKDITKLLNDFMIKVL